jgi:hypothetical protein
VGHDIVGGDALAGRIGQTEIIERVGAPTFCILLILSEAIEIYTGHFGLPLTAERKIPLSCEAMVKPKKLRRGKQVLALIANAG